MNDTWVERFRRALLARFEWAEQAGKSYVEIHCAGLHDQISEGENRYPACSGVMWVETAEGDCDIVDAPPGGVGPGLIIRYGLPRRHSPFGDRERGTDSRA